MTTGFLSGIAVLLILSQLPNVTRYSVSGANSIAQTLNLVAHLREVSLLSVAMAALTLVIGMRSAVALMCRRGDRALPDWVIWRNTPRPSMATTREYTSPFQESVALMDLRRNTHAVRSSRNGGTGANEKVSLCIDWSAYAA